MTEYADHYPTARKRHRCGLCWRFIEPGEGSLPFMPDGD